MKRTLLFATLSMVFASPAVLAKSELEILRARCAEQERQIQQLEQDNMRLRGETAAPRPPSGHNTLVSNTESSATERPKPSDSVYMVKQGDSFEKIARKTGTSVANLVKLNRLKPNAMIHPGQKLKVVGNTVAATSSTAPTKSTPSKPATTGKTYLIRSGDTYSSIARTQKVSVANLIAANPSVEANALRVGQKIHLDAATSSPSIASIPTSKPFTSTASTPVSAPKAPATHAPTPAPVPSSTPAPLIETAAADPLETPSPTSDKKFRAITIDGEMTYGDFASQHGTDTDRLNALNGLDLNNTTVLAKGSELYVPAQP